MPDGKHWVNLNRGNPSVDIYSLQLPHPIRYVAVPLLSFEGFVHQPYNLWGVTRNGWAFLYYGISQPRPGPYVNDCFVLVSLTSKKSPPRPLSIPEGGSTSNYVVSPDGQGVACRRLTSPKDAGRAIVPPSEGGMGVQEDAWNELLVYPTQGGEPLHLGYLPPFDKNVNTTQGTSHGANEDDYLKLHWSPDSQKLSFVWNHRIYYVAVPCLPTKKLGPIGP